MTRNTWTLPLDSSEASLASVGGKGLNLARLVRAGFSVPGGFLITTAAYRSFVQTNNLQPFITQALAGIRPDDPQALQEASAAIRARFDEGVMADTLAAAFTETYGRLENHPVAVRSSATAEDLPDMSFAGQQDTFLNILGAQNLLDAIVHCWSSLWTARAIGYRARNHISSQDVALAVVVQEMVESEASGVLFTANPLSGKRSETVIDATLGLGEALVSGQVEPDHYVVDRASGEIIEKKVGAKALIITSEKGGGIHTTVGQATTSQAIPDGIIKDLVDLGQNVAEHYQHEPQDIEWGWAEEKLFLLQSRPITSLYPLPPAPPSHPLQVMFSFAAVQGIMDPITPLGQDIMIYFFSGLSRLFQPHTTPESQGVALVAAERLYLNFTGALRHAKGRKLMLAAMGWIEPSVRQATETLLYEPDLSLVPRHIRLISWLRLLRFMAGMIARMLYTIARPDAGRRAVQKYFLALENQVEDLFQPATSLTQQLDTLEHFFLLTTQQLFSSILPRIAGGMSMLNLLLKLARPLPDGESLVLEITRGLPHNVTTEMDLALWETAKTIRNDSAALMVFRQEDAATLARFYLHTALPPVAQQAVSDFLARYGMRGLGEIDMGRLRWREDPTPVMQSLQSYLHIERPDQAPDEVFRRGAVAAEQAIERLAGELRRTPRGRIKSKMVRFAARRVRALNGLRETPKFLIIRIMGIIRTALLKQGEVLAADNVIQDPTDLFYLHLTELRALAEGDRRDWQALVEERRAQYAQEKRRRQIPRLLLSDGRAFYEGLHASANDGEGIVTGSPVSPGVVEGTVHVVFDPTHVQLKPGEILVCPGTDPSWTPLFLAAGGLVMEVGGMMTHGSVVAREYGIPAVVGVHQATTRLQTGKRVRVNGSSGEVHMLDGSESHDKQIPEVVAEKV